jgi:formylglycine-generating enzyme required for sulfatase activity/predicted Ser/Thr protein kinase
MPEQPFAPDPFPASITGPLPKQFGRYQLLQVLGSGGMGTVYLAQDTQLGRQVAVKIPHSRRDRTAEFLQRFAREARSAATLDHPNICPVYDVGQVEGIDYLTMAYVQGKPLSDLIAPDRPMPPKQAVALIGKLAQALQEAHAHGIIHRDLKPANVMVNARGEPVIMDFGLAWSMEPTDMRLTQKGVVLGTPTYMAPEQFRGDAHLLGPRCDIYALGVLLYQLLTGQVPFHGPPTVVMALVLTQEPPPPSQLRPGLDPDLEAICLKAMAKKLEERYASMEELADALGKWLRSEPAPITKPARGPATPRVPTRRGHSTEALPRRSWRETIPVRPVSTLPRRPRKPTRWLVVAIAAAILLGWVLVILVSVDWGRKDGRHTAPSTAPGKQAARPDDPPEIENSIGMRLAWILAGKFLMGSPEGEQDREADEGPRHSVEISKPFYLGKYEVTQEQYQKVMGKNPCRFSAQGEGRTDAQGLADTSKFPVENVSWQDAEEFCRRLSELTEEKDAGRRYELPTEAEWEYACRAETATPFHFGLALNGRQANCNGRFPFGTSEPGPNLGRPCAVGSYPANAWRLYDMHGNVAEWCRDWYARDYYKSGNNKDPHGPDHEHGRVVRGGSWSYTAGQCRAARRDWEPPAHRSATVGFRVSLHLD